MPTIHVNDIEMYDEGEPLVLIVGLGTDLSEWDGIIGWLAKKYRVFAFDNRGAGRTDKPDLPYSLEMMADDTEGLMNALAIEQAHILGISMGGRIALAFVLQHPQRVKSLILVSTYARRRQKRRWFFGFLGLVSSSPLFRSTYPQPHDACVRQRQASFEYDCVDRLHELHVPTVILHGKKEKTVPYELAEEMHAAIHASKMVPFEGGHSFFW
jgi:pimeloyl-ACP methyl ester carboxylesterase